MIILLIFWLPIVFCCPCKNWKLDSKFHSLFTFHLRPCLPANRFYIQSFFSPIALWCLLNILILYEKFTILFLKHKQLQRVNSSWLQLFVSAEFCHRQRIFANWKSFRSCQCCCGKCEWWFWVISCLSLYTSASSQRVLDWVSFFEKSVSTIESSSLDAMMSNLQIDIASAKVVSDNILAKFLRLFQLTMTWTIELRVFLLHLQKFKNWNLKLNPIQQMEILHLPCFKISETHTEWYFLWKKMG